MGSVLACSLACGSDPDGNGGEGVFDSSVGAGNGDSGSIDAGRDGSLDASGARDATTRDGGSRDAGPEPECGALVARVRDFTPATNPDFESFGGALAKGIVATDLGPDGKPVFALARNVTSKSSFDQWYNDVPGVNIRIDYPIMLTAVGNDQFEYVNSNFFPLDNMGFGNYADTKHNYHFTTQINTEFKYVGGEVFDFEGDDDLWIFVNGKLALDLGGVHSSLKGTVDFDAQAAQLGIVKGGTYRMDIFHAERQTIGSNFKIRTTIACFRTILVI
jgi:fibro-slime domain-containing protein